MSELEKVDVKIDSEVMVKEFMRWVRGIPKDSVWTVDVEVEPLDALPLVAIQLSRMRKEVTGEYLKWLCETEEHAKSLLRGIQNLRITEDMVEIEVKYKPPHWEERREKIVIRMIDKQIK